MVTSLDGAATVGGRSGGLSGGADQQVFAMLRALADVILVGAGTARVEGYRPVRPRLEGVRWAWLRAGRTPSPPIAVITRRLDLDLESPLLAGSPAHARTIVITTEAAPPAPAGSGGAPPRMSSWPAGTASISWPRSPRWPAAGTGASSPRAARTC